MEHQGEELISQLPWYLNGTLSDGERQKIDELLRRSPEARAELNWLRQIQDQVRTSATLQPLPPPEAGMDKLMALIEGEKSGKVAPLQRPVTPQRPEATMQKPVARWYRPAFGIAAAVLIAQAAVMGVMVQENQKGDSIKALSGGAATTQKSVVLQMTFKPAATEPQIRATLAMIGGEIVGGPGVIGVYTVRVPAGQGQSVMLKLDGQKDVVESANLISSN